MMITMMMRIIYFSDSSINFEKVYSFKQFSIIIDGLGLVIDSKFSDTLRKKYLDLCCS